MIYMYTIPNHSFPTPTHPPWFGTSSTNERVDTSSATQLSYASPANGRPSALGAEVLYDRTDSRADIGPMAPALGSQRREPAKS